MSFSKIDSSAIFTHLLDKTLFKSSNNYKAGPLAGLSFSVKDNISIINHASTLGCSTSSLPTSLKSATSIKTLLDLGAQLIGATHMDDYALGSYGESSICGRAINPTDKDSICGGSSFGSALSVAIKMCDFSLATDSGGSVRIPAVACGIPSIKLTLDSLPREGTYFVDDQFDSFGFFGETLQDLKLLCQSIETRDPLTNRNSNANLIVPNLSELEVCHKDILNSFSLISQKLNEFFKLKLLKKTIDFNHASNIRKILFARSFDLFIKSYEINKSSLTKEGIALLKLASSLEDSTLRKLEADRRSLTESIIDILNEGAILTPAIPSKLPNWHDLDSGRQPTPPLNHFLTIANICNLPSLVFPITTSGTTLYCQLLGHPSSNTELCKIALKIQSTPITY